THLAKNSLEESSKHLLGKVLDEAQKELESLGVSNTSLNRLIHSAKKEGALGAKLTGGGNGGCIIALARNEMHAAQIEIGRASCRERGEIWVVGGRIETDRTMRVESS